MQTSFSVPKDGRPGNSEVQVVVVQTGSVAMLVVSSFVFEFADGEILKPLGPEEHLSAGVRSVHPLVSFPLALVFADGGTLKPVGSEEHLSV